VVCVIIQSQVKLRLNTVRTKLHRIGSILFENRTHSKIDVRFCSIAEPNRTSIVRLSSIDFLFDFVRLDTPGTYQGLALLAEHQPRVRPAIYTALLDRLGVVNRHMIV